MKIGEDQKLVEEKGEKSEGLWDTSRGGMEKVEHALKRPTCAATLNTHSSSFGMEPSGMTPVQVAHQSGAFAPFSSSPPPPEQKASRFTIKSGAGCLFFVLFHFKNGAVKIEE